MFIFAERENNVKTFSSCESNEKFNFQQERTETHRPNIARNVVEFRICSPVSQSFPVQPGEQAHSYPFTLSSHVPCLHGFVAQSSMSAIREGKHVIRMEDWNADDLINFNLIEYKVILHIWRWSGIPSAGELFITNSHSCNTHSLCELLESELTYLLKIKLKRPLFIVGNCFGNWKL